MVATELREDFAIGSVGAEGGGKLCTADTEFGLFNLVARSRVRWPREKDWSCIGKTPIELRVESRFS